MILWHVATSAGARFEWAQDEEELLRQLVEYNNGVLNAGEPDEQLAEDATVEEAIEKIEEQENFSREDMWGGFAFNPRERDTILAALRVLQDWRAGREPDAQMVDDIARNGDHDNPLSLEEIDSLCERLNT